MGHAPTITCATAWTLAIVPLTALAEPPALQSPSPVIYLADNLDEKDALGWCIDTEGRGFAEQLQAHSCKPQGGDTQFSFDAATGMIQSVAFAGKCVTLSDPENAELPFGLLDCVEGEPTQQFDYDVESMEFRLAGDETRCVVVAASSIAAGPFMSRDLIHAPCADTDPLFKQWVVRK